MDSVFACTRLSKYFFEKRWLFQDLSFCLNPGEITLLQGPNGSGKTTLLKIMAGLLSPNSGEMKIQNQKYSRKKHFIRKEIGYVGASQDDFFPSATVYDNLKFFSQLQKIKNNHAQQKIYNYAQELHFELYLKSPFQQLSSGYKKRVSIARALLHEPKLLLLDEVLNSLDKDFCEQFMLFLHQWCQAHGAAALLVSHQQLNIDFALSKLSLK